MDLTSITDPALVERAQQGDQRSFAELVSRHDARLRAVASRLLRDPDRVDDALQEAYLKAFRNIARFRRDSSVGTWLHRITYNACLDDLRRRRPTPDGSDDAPDRPSAEHGPAERAVARMEVAAVLGDMAADVRATVVLVHAYGYDYAEAADMLGVPTGTIASRLHRARTRLRAAA
jgi:RNA polymerase sigma-70 factor (ECF subfamily)